jgi:hypothetical protein
MQGWLKQPLTDLEAIRGRHDVVEAMLGDAQLRADLRGLHLRGKFCRTGPASACLGCTPAPCGPPSL